MSGSTSVDRIKTALNVLRTELVELRNQDVHLMKKLISINNSLQEMSREKRLSLSRSSSKSSISSLQAKQSSESLTTSTVFKDYTEYCSDSDSEISQTTRTVPYVAMILPENEQDVSESYYRDILTTNVKLWKRSMSDDSDEDV